MRFYLACILVVFLNLSSLASAATFDDECGAGGEYRFQIDFHPDEVRVGDAQDLFDEKTDEIVQISDNFLFGDESLWVKKRQYRLDEIGQGNCDHLRTDDSVCYFTGSVHIYLEKFNRASDLYREYRSEGFDVSYDALSSSEECN